jgi:anti-sigma factor RsiW
MACEEWRDKLDLYLDGELDGNQAGAMGAHVQNCAGCAAESLARLQVKRTVQSAGKRYAPSTSLRSQISKRVYVPQRPIFGRWRLVLIPILALLIAAFWLNYDVGRNRQSQQRIYSELADLHVATLASPTPVDVLSSDRHTVKPWFQGKIPFSFILPELAGSELSLLGGRVAYLEQTPGAHLLYQVRKHEISVFIFPEDGKDMRNLSSGARVEVSFNTESWTQNGLRYFVIGDASGEDIRHLSKLLRDAA